MPSNSVVPLRGYTVTDTAKLLRVSEDKIRSWIRSGELSAVNTAGPRTRKPRFVILPHAIEQFASARSAAESPKTPYRRRRTDEETDYFPDL
jgi:excisionase family DNA binding protein